MVYLHLASFTQHKVCKVHPCCSLYHYFIPFFNWIIVHCVDIPLVYSFISGWTFGLFPFGGLLWITLLWTWNIWGFVPAYVFSIYLRVKLLDYKVCSCLAIWGTAKLLSKAAAAFHILKGTLKVSNTNSYNLTLLIQMARTIFDHCNNLDYTKCL